MLFPNIRHMVAFIEVAQRGSVNSAAKIMNLSQPAVSQEVAKFEAVFGYALFDRTPTGLTLNDLGRIALSRVMRAHQYLRDSISSHVSDTSALNVTRILRRISSNQLKFLIAVVEHGSIPAAREATQKSATTLHKSLRALELAIGIELFEKTSYGLKPRKEAETLANGVLLAFSELRQARAEIGRASCRERV